MNTAGSSSGLETGTITRVSGPLVEITGLQGLSMLEIVAIGPERISAQVVAINGENATLQAYEYTGGLKSGDPAERSGHQLSGLLGPGLLGTVFDGLLRPLSSAPLWLTQDRQASAEDPTVLETEWEFTPSVNIGDTVQPGQIIGTVPGAGTVEFRVMVPPAVAGVVQWLAEGSVHPLDPVARVDGVEVPLAQQWPVHTARPFGERLTEALPLHTGQRVLDLLFPLPRGSAAAVPGGFGTGKTLTLQQIAKWSDADVIVYVGCGERGNEMADVLDGLSDLDDPRTGGKLIDRTVIIANTSNMPMMAREASIASGVTVAEFFRDMGYDAVVIADSTSRWAEALREFANRNGDLPAEEGYPASLASELSAFYERAARVRTLGGATASVTVIGAVSPPGGDMSEPVTTDTQRFVRSLWVLDRDLAYSRHYPAVSWRGSFARDAEALARWHTANGDPLWAQRRASATLLLSEADRLTALAEIIGTASLPGHEQMVLLGGRLVRDGVLLQNALSPNDGYSSAEKGSALLQIVLDVVDACQALVARGVPAADVERVDFTPVLRLRETTGPADADGVWTQGREFLRQLEQLGGAGPDRAGQDRAEPDRAETGRESSGGINGGT
ncbi:V-type ATP synthase subunit A [Arthrobacter sunyaminii]|uniref:V-type ATP synthase subunit A n=1 Tax=Arthrobacter sunyaminii TaxID=2816859 RepID=A0A975S874_9MICC|nr:V-type ATP synthase subunit A [Arthrobacter sunyaminii]MBO0906824.1 V-type ATP synthase subunit A [Arthrobacter sunyaminii]QWQ37585.1 V-type ATP synthase subunit A [Arthrobacter sunyaminii]